MKLNSFAFALMAVAIGVLANNAGAQTTDGMTRPEVPPITFACSPDLAELANVSRNECREVFRQNRTRFTTESSVDSKVTDNDEDGFDDTPEDIGATTDITSSDRSARRGERRRRRRQRFHMFKTCIYNRIKDNPQVKEIQPQCEKRVAENNMGKEENRPMKAQFCVTGTVFKNCFPDEHKFRKGFRFGMRRRFSTTASP